MSFWNAAALVLGLTATTVFSRGLFLLARRPWSLPPRLRQALRYAPGAALVGVIAPELLLPSSLGPVWLKLGAAAAAAAYFSWRRGILGTIVCGMLSYWLLRAGLG